ncbi:MAG: helix-turn-helix domain-containing protein [Clostridia bacterium]|nr:helix-turn-helix domain-containing protein [Clostridia bacterium]
MADGERLYRLRERLEQLDTRISVGEPAPEDAEGMREAEGLLRLVSWRLRLCLTCGADTPGAADLLRLALSLAGELLEQDSQPDSLNKAWRLILEGRLAEDECLRLAARYQLKEHQTRCVLILRTEPGDAQALDALKEIVPLESGDALLPWHRGSAALVKAAGRTAPEEELLEYAKALQETFLGEMGRTLRIGVGSAAQTLAVLKQSAEEAEHALDIGLSFHPTQEVFVYRSMLLERFLSSVPPETRERFLSIVFSKNTAKLFNDEMLTTIDMFFETDLNASDAARQLYIHRNTLMYRLDKVQRATGLDLRSFEDAVTFKLLMEMKRREDHLKGGIS